MSRFVALRPLNTKHGMVQPGDPVIGAENWPPSIIIAEVNAGNVYDLNKVYKINVGGVNAIRRQKGLLELMQKHGRYIGPSHEDPKVDAVHEMPAPVVTPTAHVETPAPAAPAPAPEPTTEHAAILPSAPAPAPEEAPAAPEAPADDAPKGKAKKGK